MIRLLFIVICIIYTQAKADTLDDQRQACIPHLHEGNYQPRTFDKGFEYCEDILKQHNARHHEVQPYKTP